MKKLLILPLLVLLTGCVTYYYPETALEDGVYYAEDDPSYAVYSDGYAGVAYYPWSSLDYFYLGYHPYPGWGLGYGYGAYGSGFSFGVSYGYSPWYYPYNAYGYYYSPWYASHYHYPHYPAWRPYRGYCTQYQYRDCRHDSHNKHRDRGKDRYAGNDHDDRRYRDGEDSDDSEFDIDRQNESRANSYSTSPVRRYVSTAPAGNSSNRGMVIRSRETTKIGKSQLEPDKPAPSQTINVIPAQSRTAQPDYSTNRSSGNEVRNRSGSRQTRSRSTSSSSSRREPKVRDSSHHRDRK